MNRAIYALLLAAACNGQVACPDLNPPAPGYGGVFYPSYPGNPGNPGNPSYYCFSSPASPGWVRKDLPPSSLTVPGAKGPLRVATRDKLGKWHVVKGLSRKQLESAIEAIAEAIDPILTPEVTPPASCPVPTKDGLCYWSAPNAPKPQPPSQREADAQSARIKSIRNRLHRENIGLAVTAIALVLIGFARVILLIRGK
jgi:hypothetical protein